MFYYGVGFILFFLQVFYIFKTAFIVYPEMYFLPWLVSKGMVPYKDFFDHHGFLLYYILAPFTADKTHLALKFFYLAVQSGNLILVLLIFKKQSNKLGYVVGGGLYLLMNFFVSENILWYETVITVLYLLSYLLLTNKNKNYFLTGLIIGLTGLIKPTAGLIIIPLFFFVRNRRLAFGFILIWVASIIYFYYRGGLNLFFSDLIFYNQYLKSNLNSCLVNSFFDKRIALYTAMILGIGFICLFLAKKIKNYLLPVIFLLTSFIFTVSGYSRLHLLPLVSFVALIIGRHISDLSKKKLLLAVYLLCLTVYVVFFLGLAKHNYENFVIKKKPQYNYQSLTNQEIFKKKDIFKSKEIFVFGDNSEIYYLLDKLPFVQIPLRFPCSEKYFSSYQNEIISRLKSNRAELVIKPKIQSPDFPKLEKLKNYITDSYQQKIDLKEYILYK